VAEKLQRRYLQLQQGGVDALQEEYRNTLYRLDEQHWFALPDGNRFRGTIRGVEASGALLVEDAEGAVGSYMFKEIEFVLKNR
jgi:BirA family biotin operon repressor/biotin-[acetyl-CoA-carboxylase] ligase